MTTNGENLSIKHLARSGQLLNLITCYPGKVSVLRSTTPASLAPYRDALSGRGSSENIQLSFGPLIVDPRTFQLPTLDPEDERSHFTVRDLAQNLSLAPDLLDYLITQLGLVGALDQRVLDLSPADHYRLCLLLGLFSSERALFLYKPFEQIDSTLRDSVAEVLVEAAAVRQKVVLITELDYRPQSWINNPAIARLQVDDAARQTIGFGGGQNEINDLIQQLRQTVQEEAQRSGGRRSVRHDRDL